MAKSDFFDSKKETVEVQPEIVESQPVVTEIIPVVEETFYAPKSKNSSEKLSLLKKGDLVKITPQYYKEQTSIDASTLNTPLEVRVKAVFNRVKQDGTPYISISGYLPNMRNGSMIDEGDFEILG